MISVNIISFCIYADTNSGKKVRMIDNVKLCLIYHNNLNCPS